ncbi:MAG: DUF1294 domain-containing protein [Phenylobacterium sp.]
MRAYLAPMFEIAVLYLLAINLAAFLAFRADKRRAEKGDRRIPERVLLRLAAFGGTSGALVGQQLLRHKTRKQPFGRRLWMIAATQGAILVLLALYLAR